MINFETKDTTTPFSDFRPIAFWLERVAESHGKKIGRLNYLFCNDDEILRVNREFLSHDYFTDIITFDYSAKDKVSGDVFISVDTVESNAAEFHEPFPREMLRVIAHGLLHLCGIDDKGVGEREIMEANENKALELFDSLYGK